MTNRVSALSKTLVLSGGLFTLMAAQARAAAAAPTANRAETGEPASAPAADVARLEADVNRLKQEARDQRQLILQLMQMDQQRYDVLLRYLQSMNGASAEGLPGPLALPASPLATGAADKEAAPTATPREVGTISGHARVPAGAGGDLYAYVDGPRGAPVHGRTFEIRQKDKQFVPRTAVVPLGTRVVFPNADSVIHNVFSSTPGSAFDLGSVKGGERSPPVLMTRPGHVEIFCNIHSKMRADILVVPNGHWTKVAPDGSFSLPGVALGQRRVVLWGPNIKPAAQEVEVTAKGAAVSLSAEPGLARPHFNKRGQAYGSYDE